MDPWEILLGVGVIIIGAVGAVAAAVVTYLLGRRQLELRKSSSSQRLKIEEQRVEIQQDRIDLSNHEAIVQGYKDLLKQYQDARDLARTEVGDLRATVGGLSAKVEALTANHVKCETENAELKQALVVVTAELKAVREELIEMRGHYPPNVSAAPEPPATAA